MSNGHEPTHTIASVGYCVWAAWLSAGLMLAVVSFHLMSPNGFEEWWTVKTSILSSLLIS
ncbi:hypothetical protein [Rhodocytophaga aerolata]|uniref:hypothetical protein n=1 Tax=Rhodocytophaga aerolata TaxID=455078 RepID=UPI00366FC80A